MGNFTGRPEGPVCVGRHKTDQAARLAARLEVDLAGSYVYSDHHADKQLLEAVGPPVAVSPTPRRLRYARQRNWEVLSR